MQFIEPLTSLPQMLIWHAVIYLLYVLEVSLAGIHNKFITT